MSALQLWAGEVEDLFGISCRFECETAVLIHDDAMATHLYHIAQEAVNNAIKHGQARNIRIHLYAENGWGTLVINDDGTGIQENHPSNHGMGLHIMTYRAGMIGGRLEIKSNQPRGTCVICMFPLASARSKGKTDDDESRS
jgi:signal transduction histidine kinase